MQINARGRLFDFDDPETVDRIACDGRADRLSSVWQSEGVAYHNYRCRADGCHAGGTIVEHKNDTNRRVGPVFRDRDLAARLTTRDYPGVPAEPTEVTS